MLLTALSIARERELGTFDQILVSPLRPFETGVEILNQAFYAKENIATAGGCLASQYLAFWVIARTVGIDMAKEALYYVAPVSEKEEYITRALENITPYLG